MEINGVAFKDPDSGGGTSVAETSLGDTFDTFRPGDEAKTL